eukprot:16426936-Heterocapsa_arctica.AAC.1
MVAFGGFIADAGGLIDFHTHGKVRSQAFSILYLIRCFLLCQSLTSAAALKTAMCHAARLVMPSKAADIMEGALDNDNSTAPSPATVSRLRGRIDVSWMLIWRDRIQTWLDSNGGLAVYPGTDSSPQGGRDYQILVLDFIPRAAMPELHAHTVAFDARPHMLYST